MGSSDPFSPPVGGSDQAALQNIATAINNLVSTGLTEATISSTTSGDHTIITAQGGKKIEIFSLWLVVGSSVSLTFNDGTTAMTGAVSMVANSQLFLDDRNPPWFTCSMNSAFIINTSAAAQVSGRCYYTQRAP